MSAVPRRRRILLLFVDGVGVGSSDPERNPFAGRDWPGWTALIGAAPLERPGSGAAGLDAVLGVGGLPQSGTGQTALMTGINAPARVGGHLGPFPTAELRALLARWSLPRAARDAGLRVAFANAYPDAVLAREAAGGGRLDAVARAMALSGAALRGVAELRRGEALSASLTGEGWRERLGIEVPLVAPEAAGAQLAALAAANDLTVFAHYATDAVGHRGTMGAARGLLERYDAFLAGLLDARGAGLEIVLASDHGNLEELDHGRHTRNPALAAWHGAEPPERWAAITDVAPAIRAALGLPPLPEVDARGALD